MKRTIVTALLFLIALSAPLAAERVDGYLVDKMCSARIIEEGVDAAKAHTKECALKPACKKSGYGVVTAEGKFIKFDEDGDRMAVKMLEIASGDDDLEVVVNGDVDGSSMSVVAIQFK